ncbi:esterase-like activity of phytase family protein [Chlorogloeopsis sp. ULAP02]|uniref:esterase-like activity of phytase family protein n=1 Tax=Chlorogloeopsis sp. ULAP02 TaxID=3107926 RepID=UPI0031376762
MYLFKKIWKFPHIIYFFLLIILILIPSLFLGNITSNAVEITDIDFIGSATLPTGLSFQNTELGGLSGITYDAKNDLYYAISDDRSHKSAARIYTLKIDLSKGLLRDGDVIPVAVSPLLNKAGTNFSAGSIDPEGIALNKKANVFISSEGDVNRLIEPFIKEFSLASGREISTLPIPKKFLPHQNGKQGIRNNLAFESLTITPNEKYLFTATENALIQDGSEVKPNTGSPCRIVQYNLLTHQPEKEFLYLTETVAPFLNFSRKFMGGLTDLLALDNQGKFLSLERHFTGLGFYIALFQFDLTTASDIHQINSLLAVDTKKIKPVQKKLLLDLRKVDVLLDNIEGLTFGSKLPNGQRSLILVSDNNFNALQRTQILAFRLKIEAPFLRLLRRLRLVPNSQH